MKTATVRQVQHGLRNVLEWVTAGETVIVTRRHRIVAEIAPPRPLTQKREPRPDFLARLKGVFPRPLAGKSNAEMIRHDRERA